MPRKKKNPWEGLHGQTTTRPRARPQQKSFGGTLGNLYFDNFFSSVGLMASLLERRIYAMATTRQNRKEFLKEMNTFKLKRGESKVMQKSGVNACVWQDKRKDFFLSTNAQPIGQDTVNQKNKDGSLCEVRAPLCVVVYNKYTGGVDYADQKCNDYRIRIESRRWYRYLV
ncbi:predicted protein [Nematostella vectensis]|uniref:PiggyBac transposable element-derived protein domain-containing protein n=1 Tax=Nematostella vectensis TaxID=45351 RepID=A7SBW9_NEMVE|nr:predicted protein [Nematostella vectensis]|eukprot:XP_001630863.1 predicted protein [Nematostella vectensis]